MTDEELLGYLRRSSVGYTHPLRLAADRIEALVKQCEGLAQAAMNNGQALILAEARAERLEAALNDLGLEMLRSDETQAFMQSRITTYREALSLYAKWGVENPRHDDLVRDDGGDIARAALKGADHE